MSLNNPTFGVTGNGVNFNSNNGNDRKDDKKKYTFTLSEPEAFPSFADTAAMTTSKLSVKLNEFFSLAYKDFDGTKICVAPNGAFLEVKLYFSKAIVKDNGKPAAFTDFVSAKTSGNSIIDAINNIGSRPTQKMYNPTQELKDGMERFLFGYGNPSFKPDWNRLITEETEYTNTGACVYGVISGIDIKKIIPEIYGKKDEEGDDCFYDVNINRPTSFVGANGMMLPMSNIDYLITILRIKYSELKKLANTVGVIQMGNTLGITHAR